MKEENEKHVFVTKYTFGNIVYLKTDNEQLPRMVTGIYLTPNGFIYYLSNGESESKHYDIEITSNVNQSLKLGLSD